MPTNIQIRAAWCLAAYLYNTSGVQFAKDVYGEDSHPNYLAEKANRFAESPSRALGDLDDEHFAALVETALHRHSAAAIERFGL